MPYQPTRFARPREVCLATTSSIRRAVYPHPAHRGAGLRSHRFAEPPAGAATWASLSIRTWGGIPIRDRLYSLDDRQHTNRSDIRPPRRALATLAPARIRHGTSPQTPQQRVRPCKCGVPEPPRSGWTGRPSAGRLRARRDAHTRRTHPGHTRAVRPCASCRSLRRASRTSASCALGRRLRSIPSVMAAEEAHAERQAPDLPGSASRLMVQVRILSESWVGRGKRERRKESKSGSISDV